MHTVLFILLAIHALSTGALATLALIDGQPGDFGTLGHNASLTVDALTIVTVRPPDLQTATASTCTGVRCSPLYHTWLEVSSGSDGKHDGRDVLEETGVLSIILLVGASMCTNIWNADLRQVPF